jgi:zinc protease
LIRRLHILVAAAIVFAPCAANAIDLRRTHVSRFDNGLTLLILEDHTLPVVSVQAAYKTGGRDDPEGRMGLAHFFEHMAFRASKNFPETGLVSEIYAAGGEWHGYTWIDTITFFATAPKDDLDLLLRIEADRLGRLDMAKEDVAAETGAVLAEMNGYANDPATALFDATLAAAFQVHPYRKNTIGYAADVGAITHDDIVRFYRERIGPKTAVLAIAGDVDADAVEARVKKLFGKFKGAAEPALPPDSEPPFAGEKRVRLEGASDTKLFRIVYPAPAASSADYPAFLVLQALAGASSGVSFLQNDWGTLVAEGSALAGAADDLKTWFIPTAQPYVFLVAGSADLKADETRVETAVQQALDGLATAPIEAGRLAAARAQVRRELVFDLETTEDAAHQLAYFEAIGALDQLLTLEESIDAVTADDIRRLAELYLNMDRRTVGWFVPADEAEPALPPPAQTLQRANERRCAPANASTKAFTPIVDEHIAVWPSSLSPTIAIKTVLAGAYDCALCAANDPAPGMTSITVKGLNDELGSLLSETRAAIAAATPAVAAVSDGTDPSTRLEQVLAARFDVATANTAPTPAFATIAGDIDSDEAKAAVSEEFGSFNDDAAQPALSPSVGDIAVSIPEDKAQAALGYMAEAPARDTPEALAWRLALYMFAHDYGGRLGDEAISRRGLAYYIGADYRGGAIGGLVTLSIGVDPDKQAALKALLQAELKRFIAKPPDAAELAEAKRHLIGRRISAAQSNEELAARLADIWTSHGIMNADAYAEAVNAVTLDQLLKILPAFTSGDVITVSVGDK